MPDIHRLIEKVLKNGLRWGAKPGIPEEPGVRVVLWKSFMHKPQ